MHTERMELPRIERARYFAPTVICGYLAGVCLLLTVTSPFLHDRRAAAAMIATALMGLLVTAGFGVAIWLTQRHEMRFEVVGTGRDASANFPRLRALATERGWQVLGEDPGRRLELRTPASRFGAAERLSIRCRGTDVLIACICDPSVGFSLVGRRRCGELRQFLRETLRSAAPAKTQTAG